MRPPAALLPFAFFGCVDVGGGAVELAWELFAPSGSACCANADPCRAAGAQLVRVHLHAGTCAGGELAPVRTFNCKSTQGATQFDIPHGTYCIEIDAAADAIGAPVASGPGPILREVATGDVVELGAVALTVGDGSKCDSCP